MDIDIGYMYYRAMWLAILAHDGQLDKGGLPYINHPVAVSNGVKTAEMKIVAFLHDAIEDTSITRLDLENCGFTEEIISAIELLTRKRGEAYFDYIKRIKDNELTRNVKLSDLKHNMDMSRLPAPTAVDYGRCAKYHKAYNILIS